MHGQASCVPGIHPTITGITGILIFALGPALTLAQPERPNDVSVEPTVTANVPCAGCPGGTGTKLCYEVNLDANAENNHAKDFHINVGAANLTDFLCATVERRNANGTYTVLDTWSSMAGSQVEVAGGPLVKYFSWYSAMTGGDSLDRGETYRFCVVYCGNVANNMDNSLEWMLTDNGSSLPDIPNPANNNDRPNIPGGDNGSGGLAVDDPGWFGTRTIPNVPRFGFICCGVQDVPVFGPAGIAALGLAIASVGGVLAVKRRRDPSAR